MITVIREAAEKGHLEVVKLLLEDNRVDPSADNSKSILKKLK